MPVELAIPNQLWAHTNWSKRPSCVAAP